MKYLFFLMMGCSFFIEAALTGDRSNNVSHVVRHQPTSNQTWQDSRNNQPCVITCNFCNNITCHCPSNSCNLLSNVAGFLGTAATTVLSRVKDLIHNDSDPKP